MRSARRSAVSFVICDSNDERIAACKAHVQVSGDLISFMTGCSKAAGWCDGPQDASSIIHVITDQRV